MTAASPLSHLTLRPLYKVQEAALEPAIAVYLPAAHELGRRYVEALQQKSLWTDRYRRRLASAYARGWMKLEPRYANGRGGNHAATLRSAEKDGARDRRAQERES